MFTQEEKDKYMNLAIEQARIAEKQDEVPIGAIVIDPEGNVVGRGYNRRELDQDATQHAEIIAIREACDQIGYWRLVDCSIFITLEPCPMCAGAIINSRIKNVFFGAYDPKAGASGSVIDLFAVEKFNHHPEVEGGVKENETSQMLTQFFRAIRAKKKAEKLAMKNKSEE
ncbi:tRNA adenosine(34) deaminase TadA [Lactobacillus agrestimuris]|uniref:tRNA adenosine(34) deaminase TadA n=1 Tax=Lactobacillus agrestimuris TaxID=2941328 RepID=UPI002042FB72|nr:tRNA adenosine(34) deaminase TadA [Lactobacillus agrestimuris]